MWILYKIWHFYSQKGLLIGGIFSNSAPTVRDMYLTVGYGGPKSGPTVRYTEDHVFHYT